MAINGIAATLLPNGKPVHKVFGLPVPLYVDSTFNIELNSKEAGDLEGVDVFIWDEAPMASWYASEIMDRTMRDVMNDNLPFGGNIVILGGDFRQLLPIKLHGTRSETVHLPIKFGTFWECSKKHKLTVNMWVLPEEMEFTEFLVDVGDGIRNDHNDEIRIPQSCVISGVDVDITDVIYKDLIAEKQFRSAAKYTILSACNSGVDELNQGVVNLLDSRGEEIYTSVDSGKNCDDNGHMGEILLPEYLNSLSPAPLPSRKYS